MSLRTRPASTCTTYGSVAMTQHDAPATDRFEAGVSPHPAEWTSVSGSLGGARDTSSLTTRFAGRDLLTPAFIRRWRDLASRSLTPNPFIEPEFVLPALQHLPGLSKPVLATVEDHRGRLLGLGLFEEVPASRRLPVPHLRAWQTPHTYLDGLLVDRSVAPEVLRQFWTELIEGSHSWHGVEFPRFREADSLGELMSSTAASANVEWSDARTWTRAMLRTDQSPEQLARGVSPKRARSLRRGWRELERLGSTEFRVDRCDAESVATPIAEFLGLEALGWKAANGTALDCCEDNRRFFQEMMAGFAASGRTLFSRVRVNQSTIAIVAHVLSGEGAFAFKLGWDPETERGCPGFQLKAQLLEHAEELLPDIRWVDSCASEGSFIEHVWADRSRFQSRMFLTSRAAVVASAVLGTARSIRNALLGRGATGTSAGSAGREGGHR